jgi:hypothetical protein
MLTPNQRRAVAYHEAAHAAVAYALGDVPTACEFTDRGGRTTRRGINKSVQDQICMSLAGMAMDRRLGLKVTSGYDRDCARIWNFAFDAFPHYGDAIMAVSGAESRMPKLIQHVARGAMLLGGELFKHGALDRQQIDSILSKTVTRLKSPRAVMAMDQRRIDHDGRMHVDNSNLSMAAIDGYRGEEIPHWEQLGLEPKKVYMLLRHPDELKRAADSFNGLPILDCHVPMDADSHLPFLVVGSSGSRAKFEPPYLTNAISLWTRDAIDNVNSGKRKELSCAYSYYPVMQPGVYQGQKYDGIMTELRGNHVALVEDGRCGADCVVGDSANCKSVRRFAMGHAFDQLPRGGANVGEWRSTWAFKRKDDGAARVGEKLQARKEKLSAATATKDEEPHMPFQQPNNKPPLQQPNMQQMEDPNKIGARTNQSRGPTQQQTFGREVQGPEVDAQLPEEMKHHPGQVFGIPGTRNWRARGRHRRSSRRRATKTVAASLPV